MAKKKRDENLKGIQRIRLPAPNFACFPNLFQLKKIKIKVREIYWKKLPYAAETGSLGIMVSHSRAWWWWFALSATHPYLYGQKRPGSSRWWIPAAEKAGQSRWFWNIFRHTYRIISYRIVYPVQWDYIMQGAMQTHILSATPHLGIVSHGPRTTSLKAERARQLATTMSAAGLIPTEVPWVQGYIHTLSSSPTRVRGGRGWCGHAGRSNIIRRIYLPTTVGPPRKKHTPVPRHAELPNGGEKTLNREWALATKER